MTEQYIYSRSDREFVNARNQTIPLGFGFMAFSPGMDNALKREVAVHCEDCPRLSQTDQQSIPLPLFRKTFLPRGQVLLQKSTWIETGSRGFHVAHGYVLDDEAVRSTGPAQWLNAVFQLGDPNAVPEGPPLLESRLERSEQEPLKFRCLKDAALGLNSEQFCQMLLACFDALVSRRQVWIAWDFGQLREQDLRRSVLFWIYTCLPYDLWIRLGFDSVYTDRSAPGLVHLAFVDAASIRGEGQTFSIQSGNQKIPLGGNFLIMDGKIIHNDGKYQTEWYHKNTAYTRWLERLVNIVWKHPGEKREAVVRELEKIRRSFQSRLPGKAEGMQLDPRNYNRACEAVDSLQNLKDTAGPGALPVAAVRTAPSQRHGPGLDEVYSDLFQRCMQSHSLADIEKLAGIRGEKESDAIELLSALMARDVDRLQIRIRTILDNYKRLLRDIYDQLPRRVFWGQIGAKGQVVWNQCNVDSGVDAAKCRRYQFYEEMDDSAKFCGLLYRGLRGLSVEQYDSMKKEYHQARLIMNVWNRFCEDTKASKVMSVNADDIHLLGSMCGGEMGDFAMGYLSAFMAGEADALWSEPPSEKKLSNVLNSYQSRLLPELYSRLLYRPFWNELTDVERWVWRKRGVQDSNQAAQRRRIRWCEEIADHYSRPEDVISFLRSSPNMILGIDKSHCEIMEADLERVVQQMKK